MNNHWLTMRLLMWLPAVVWLTGCGLKNPFKPSAPPVGEVAALVRSRAPATVKVAEVRVRSAQLEKNTWAIEFEADVAPHEDLYEVVDLDQELARLGWTRRNTAAAATMLKPSLIRLAYRPSDTVVCVGRLTARHSSTWQADQFQWDLEDRLAGAPRTRYPAATLVCPSAAANGPIYQYVRQGRFAALPVGSGEMYKQASFESLDPESVVVGHAQGISHVPFGDLPPVLQEFLHYDPAAVEAMHARREAVAERRAAQQAARPVEVRAPPPPEPNRPEPPPSNVDDLITARLRQCTALPNSIMVRPRSPVFDDTVWAWKVEFEYSFYYSDGRSPGGERVEGTSYAWFRDKLLVKWRDIVPPRSPLP